MLTDEEISADKAIPITNAPARVCDRLTQHLMVTHESCTMKTTQTRAAFTRLLDTKHQVWERYLTITDKEELIAPGCWIPDSDVSYVVIENRVGTLRVRNPSKEELEIEAKQIILVGSDSLWQRVRPGQAVAFEPCALGCWRIRTAGGFNALCAIQVFPK